MKLPHNLSRLEIICYAILLIALAYTVGVLTHGWWF